MAERSHTRIPLTTIKVQPAPVRKACQWRWRGGRLSHTLPTTMERPQGFQSSLPWLLRVLVAVAALIVIVAGVRAVAPVLSSFLVALLLAQVLIPLTLQLMRAGVPRAVAVTLTIAVILVGGAAIVYFLGGSLAQLSRRLPDYGRQLLVLRDDAVARLVALGVSPDLLQGEGAFDPKSLLGEAAAAVGKVIAEFGHGFFIVLIAALFLIEFAVLFPTLDAPTGKTSAALLRFVHLTNDIQKYIGINAFVNLLSATALAIVMAIMHIPFIATWVVLAFLLGFIPTLGGILALIPMVLITLLEQGVQRALVFTAIYGVISFLLGEVVKPKFMQRGFEIPIVAVFASLVFWNFVLGPVGVVLAVPFTIAMRRLYHEFATDVSDIGRP